MCCPKYVLICFQHELTQKHDLSFIFPNFCFAVFHFVCLNQYKNISDGRLYRTFLYSFVFPICFYSGASRPNHRHCNACAAQQKIEFTTCIRFAGQQKITNSLVADY